MSAALRNLAGMNRFFHWCCKGLTSDLLFENEQEFIAGMNRIAVCYLYCLEKGHPVRIVAFCLLNNHFHFVLYGTEEDAAMFMEHYRFLTTRWIQAHRGERLHEKIDLGHWSASTSEKIKQKVIYTLRQTLEAGLRITPQGYPWCSAKLMFNNNDFFLECSHPVGEVSIRTIRKIVSSEVSIPATWKILPGGIIWPGDYTEVASAENLFNGVKDFMFCLNNSNNDKAVLAEMNSEVPSIPDTEVKDKAEDLARGLFARKNISSCPAEERIKIANYLRKELHCGYKQLARIVKMTEVDLRKSI